MWVIGSLCKNKSDAEWEKTEKEKDNGQKEYIESVLQRIFQVIRIDFAIFREAFKKP